MAEETTTAPAAPAPAPAANVGTAMQQAVARAHAAALAKASVNAPAPAAQQQPATPAQAASPAQQQMADPNALVEIKLDHTTLYEPVSKLKASYQIQSTAEKRLMDANKLKEQLAEQINLVGADADKWRSLKAELDSDPAATLQQLASIFGVRLPGSHTNSVSQTDEPEGQPAHQAADPKVEKLERRLIELERKDTIERTRTDLAQALDPYPFFKNNEAARRRAESFLAVARVQNPTTPLDKLAGEVHADMLAIAGQSTQAAYDQHQQNRQNLTVIPTGAGTPSPSEPPPMPTLAGWKSGADKTRFAAKLQQINARLNGGR